MNNETKATKAHKNLRPSPMAYVVAVGMAVLAIRHGLSPSRLLLDWPMVALLAMAAALCLVPWSTLVGLIEKFKYKEFEILLRDTTQLHEEVKLVGIEAAVGQLVDQMSAFGHGRDLSGTTEIQSISEKLEPESADEPNQREAGDDPKSFRSRALKVLAVQRESPAAALVQLSLEMEDAIISLFVRYGGRDVRKGMSLLAALDYLHRKGVVTRGLADAVRDFWKVRNRIVHSPTTGPVPDHIVESAIDSGITLLREVVLLS